MIKFSIAIPAYKAYYLAECIQSILQQDYLNFELIIVNDQSPQNIDEIVNGFDDERIKYFKNKENIGAENLVLNWNNCLEKATGDYFVMMGDDDAMEPDYLTEFAALISKYPGLDVFHCRSKRMDELSVPFALTPSWPEYESVYDNIWHRIKGYRIQYISDFVYKTSTLKSNNGFYYLPMAWGSDDISAYIACGNKGIAHVNKPVFRYRDNRYTISSSGNSDVKMKAVLMQQQWFKEFLKQVPDNENDKIIHEALLTEIDRYIKKRKVMTMAASFGTGVLKNSKHFFSTRKKNGISPKDIVFAALQHYKKAK